MMKANLSMKMKYSLMKPAVLDDADAAEDVLFADDAVQGVDAVGTLQAEIAGHGADAADAVDAAHGGRGSTC